MYCKTCKDKEPCRYTHYEETCQNCKYNTMLFDEDKDPCNNCYNGSNFVIVSEYDEH